MSGIITGIESLNSNNLPSPSTSYRATPATYQVQNSNAVVILFGGIPLTFCQASSWSVSFGTSNIKGIGSAKPQEVLQESLTARIAVDSFVLVSSGTNLTEAPSSYAGILANDSYTLIMLGSDLLPISYFIGCVCDEYTVALRTNSPLTQRMTFTAIDVLDEFFISILNGDAFLRVLREAEVAKSVYSNAVKAF